MAVVCIIIAALYILKEWYVKKMKEEEREARGVTTRKESSQFHDKCMQDVFRDWENERKFFPKEYIPYLEKNREARAEYVYAYAHKLEHEAGYMPFISPINYDQRNYNPFYRFEHEYGWKIKEYNENGVYYY